MKADYVRSVSGALRVLAEPVLILLFATTAFAQAPRPALFLTSTDGWSVAVQQGRYPTPKAGMYFFAVQVGLARGFEYDHVRLSVSLRKFSLATYQGVAYPAMYGADRLVANACGDFELLAGGNVKCSLVFELPINITDGQLEFSDTVFAAWPVFTKLR